MTTTVVQRLARVAALGAATGARSSAGLAALSITARGSDPAPVAFFAHPVTRALVGSAVLAEVVLDVHPATPVRTAPQGLVPRLVLSAGVALAMSYRDRFRAAVTATATVPGVDAATAGDVVVAVGAAAGVAYLGPTARAVFADRLGSDLPGAVAEDVLVVSAAAIGATTVAAERHA